MLSHQEAVTAGNFRRHAARKLNLHTHFLAPVRVLAPSTSDACAAELSAACLLQKALSSISWLSAMTPSKLHAGSGQKFETAFIHIHILRAAAAAAGPVPLSSN
mmetsp:Transcript_4881/g.13311  ORF Transcript_4881/g.13311 Transcript_4881/m.13311 type:complete len:104 (-) Transcript_4881:1326-1637(-)